MSPTVSFFPPTSPPNAGEAKVAAPPAEKNGADAPFSRMLDHAVRETPGRKNKPAPAERSAAKESKNVSAEKTEPAEPKLESEPRHPRLRNNKREREESESLAGACNVTTPVAATLVDKTVAAKAESSDETEAATAVEGQSADNKTPAPASEPTLVASDETTASSGLDLTTLITPAEPTSTKNQSLLNSPTPAETTEISDAKLSSPEATPTGPTSLQINATPGTAPSEATTATSAVIHLDQSQNALPENFATPTFAPIAAPVTTSAKSTAVVAVVEAAGAGNPPAATVTTAAAVVADSATEAPDSAPEEVRRSVRATRRARLETLEATAGTGGAKSSETMKTAIKKEELAGGTEQFLPVSSPNALSALRNLPGEATRKAAGQFSGPDALEAAAKTAGPAHGAPSTDTEAMFVRSTNPMARISEVISREIRMFKRGGDDLVEVVLTPDTKTQISLRLQWREGQVEVQARCDLGDYQSLNNQWAQLQSSLASHGVRLSHLSERAPTGFTEFFNNPNFAQQRGREEQSQHPTTNPDALPALPTTVVKPGATAAVRRSNRLFDSWA